MARVIQSPSKRFPGEVLLPDYLTIPQEIAWNSAIKAVEGREWLDVATLPELAQEILPGVFAVVQEWRLQGLSNLTVETFPMSPKIASAKLIAWLVGEIQSLLAEGDDPLA